LSLSLWLCNKHALKIIEKCSFAIVAAFSGYAPCAYIVGENDLTEAICSKISLKSVIGQQVSKMGKISLSPHKPITPNAPNCNFHSWSETNGEGYAIIQV
jgi:hypothetical protein